MNVNVHIPGCPIVLQVADSSVSTLGPGLAALRKSGKVQQYSNQSTHLIVDWSTVGLSYATDKQPAAGTEIILVHASQLQ